jgi:hypothetical protein
LNIEAGLHGRIVTSADQHQAGIAGVDRRHELDPGDRAAGMDRNIAAAERPDRILQKRKPSVPGELIVAGGAGEL